MKHIVLLVFLFSVSAFSSVKWSELIKDKKYKTNIEVVLEKDDFKLTLDKNATIKLIEAMSLPMIKVELLKFDISDYCNNTEAVSDIKLIDIKQSTGMIVTVGADLAEDCIMEVFVETKDVYTNSFLLR